MSNDEARELRRLLGGRVPRRTGIRAGFLTAAGLSAAALVGCGDDEDDDEAKQQPAGGGAQPTQAAAAPAEPDFVANAKADGAPFPYGFNEPTKTPKSGGQLVVGVSWDVATWDTTKSSAGGTVTVPNTAMNRLLGMVHGPKMSKYRVDLQSELAKSWEQSPDGLKYTFRLQEGVKFHNVDPINGRAFTAKDVVNVYERHRKEGVSTGFFTEVDAMTAPDDKTVVITMKKPNADFLIPLANRQLPIYPIELVDGGKIANTAIGTGPAIVTESKPGASVKFRTNPDYWDGRPYLEGMEYRIIVDTAARTAAFRTGQLDFGYSIPLNKLEADVLLKSNPDVVVLADPTLMTSSSWGLNLTNPKFQDERVRRALALAIDRQKIATIVFQGFARTIPTQAWPFVFDKFPTQEQLGPYTKFDQAESKKMLTAAGADKLEFNVIYSPAYGPQGEQESTLMVDMLKEVGVNAKLENVGGQAEFNAQWVTVKYKDAADGWATAAPSANGFYHDQIKTNTPTSPNVNNRWYMSDPDLDRLADAQKVEVNPQKRREIWKQQWDILQNKVYRLDQAQLFSLTGHQPWLRYFRFGGPYISIHWFYEWGLQYRHGWLDK